jgi:hypothetical protein
LLDDGLLNALIIFKAVAAFEAAKIIFDNFECFKNTNYR